MWFCMWEQNVRAGCLLVAVHEQSRCKNWLLWSRKEQSLSSFRIRLSHQRHPTKSRRHSSCAGSPSTGRLSPSSVLHACRTYPDLINYLSMIPDECSGKQAFSNLLLFLNSSVGYSFGSSCYHCTLFFLLINKGQRWKWVCMHIGFPRCPTARMAICTSVYF